MQYHSAKRRQLLLSMLGSAVGISLFPQRLFADLNKWDDFVLGMQTLANRYDLKQVAQPQLISLALDHLQTLDINSPSFTTAVSNAYESGNEFWLWQRLLKENNLNGGILNIDRQRIVQLHDHPGATGVLRIISGEAEVWQYDRLHTTNDGKTTTLQQVSRRILRTGDTAVLTPESGNIHALRSISNECRMLDFFIPPYQLQQRSWFKPLNKNWQQQQRLTCRAISHHEYVHA